MQFTAIIPLIIIGIVITLARSSAERKKQQQAARRRALDERNREPQVPPVIRQTPQPPQPTVRVPEAVRKAVQAEQRPKPQPKPQPKPAPRVVLTEGVGTEGPGTLIPRVGSDPHPKQKHPEHDMCALRPEEQEHNAASVGTSAVQNGLTLDLSPENILRGVLFSEIFGKPKALR